ncbi:hypothetical protein OPQ81_008297 [Rhizoctonia solani]|nr:hypothetical protein OPQ81_008297 [Rhizoctonia solani]
MARSTVTFFTLSLITSVFARVIDYRLDVANGVIAPDGVTRNAVLVNGRFPGPLISANKGDTLKVTVRNKLSDPSMRQSTTIHWHGLLQHRTAEEDGPAFVTQCPIPPKESYTYTMPLGEQTGTYWYHSHLSSQNYYDADDERTVFTLADWYHTPSEAIMAAHDVLKTIPDSGTINGRGKYDPASANTNSTQLENLYTLKVKRGKRYRLRIINASAIASFRFSVQGHKCTIIEADGVLTKPIEVDAFDILAGQRYSCILKADQDPDSYWINAPITNVLNTNVQALLVYEDDKRPVHYPWKPFLTWEISNEIIRYWQHKHGSHGHKGQGHHRKVRAIGGGSGLNPRVRSRAGELSKKAVELAAALVASEGELEKRENGDNSTIVLDQSKLVPLIQPGAPGGSRPADVVVPLDFDLNFANGLWRINNVSYSPPDIPTLLKILANQGRTEASDFATDEHTYMLPSNKVVELHIKGQALGIVHPIHLHGHAFDIVQFGNNPPNYVNPPRRDVVGVTDAGVRIQFRTDNPGPWFLHCHIDWHLEEGFAMVFAEAPDEMKKGPQSVQPDGQWKKLCQKYEKLPEELQ